MSLAKAHPLKPKEAVDAILQVWDDIFKSGIGSKPFRIGVDLFPKPQVMGFFLHELIPLELARQHPRTWCAQRCSSDKDLVYVPDDRFSVEIKTSSHKSRIFGNRSYTQGTLKAKKSKSGYYLAINFEPFSAVGGEELPHIVRIRFGWLDYSDWRGQAAASGQQAHLPPAAERSKLIELFPESQL